MKKDEEIPLCEQIVNLYLEGEISKSAFAQMLLQNEELSHWWQHHVDLKRALQDEDFVKLLREINSKAD